MAYDIYHIEEEQWLIIVGVLLCVLDDPRWEDMAANLKLNTGRRHIGKLELPHVTHTPAQHLETNTQS